LLIKEISWHASQPKSECSWIFVLISLRAVSTGFFLSIAVALVQRIDYPSALNQALGFSLVFPFLFDVKFVMHHFYVIDLLLPSLITFYGL